MSIVLDHEAPTAAAGAVGIPAIAAKPPISPVLVIELMRLYDAIAVACSGLAVYGLYVQPRPSDVDNRYFGSIALAAVVVACVAQWMKTYRIDAVFERWLGLRRALTSWIVGFVICLAIVFTLKISEFYSRVWAVSWFFLAVVVLAAGRYLVRAATRRWAKQGRFANRSLVVGTGEQAERLAQLLRARADPRTHILGFIEARRADDRRGEARVRNSIGDPEAMMSLIRRNLVDEVLIALPWSEEARIRDLSLLLATTPVRVRLAPDLIGFRFVDHAFTSRSGLPLLKVLDRPMSGWSSVAKWLEDQIIALAALVLLAPLMVLTAVAVKLDSPGPVFFKQRRFGFNDNVIEVWKFRTMRADVADADCELQTTRHDPRVTRVGRILRKTSIDELPQLLNVLRGDMSIVGPRPHAMATKAGGSLFHEVVDGYAARHRVKPGITGWAQVNGWRGETDTVDKIRRRVEYDLYYIDNWSVWFDLYILLKTAVVIFQTDKAY
jgi:Undecaprenyl-phosphate glucose phosphotransferase